MLKRADATAQSKEDVCFVHDWSEVKKIKPTFMRRGITDVVAQAHVKGDVVKFYGVEGTGFFRYYYPSDDGQFKFAVERHNGPAHHYAFDVDRLQRIVDRLAHRIEIDVYGGDVIIDAHGQMYIIDFNDWPSFSRCRDAAAEALVNDLSTK